jgi:hypothetical protein
MVVSRLLTVRRKVLATRAGSGVLDRRCSLSEPPRGEIPSIVAIDFARSRRPRGTGEPERLRNIWLLRHRDRVR